MSHRSNAPLDALLNADIDALKSLWTKTFRSSPPTSAKRDFLIRLLAYGLQERAYGALTRRRRSICKPSEHRRSTAKRPRGSPLRRPHMCD